MSLFLFSFACVTQAGLELIVVCPSAGDMLSYVVSSKIK